MDQFDRKILTAIQAYPEASVSEVAEKVGLSHTPCWRRLRRLERDGYIRGRAVMLDQRRLGLNATVFAFIRLKEHDEGTLEAFEKEVLAFPQIVDCFSMTGDADYQLRVVVEHIDAYEVFLKKTLLHLPGVASIKSSFALKLIKLSTILPIPPAAEESAVPIRAPAP